MNFPKPSFNTEELRRFTPSPTAAGGNRAARRKKFKQLPRAIRKGGVVYSDTIDTGDPMSALKAMHDEADREDEEMVDVDDPESVRMAAESTYRNNKSTKQV